jgi:hypothetical protein
MSLRRVRRLGTKMRSQRERLIMMIRNMKGCRIEWVHWIWNIVHWIWNIVVSDRSVWRHRMWMMM